MTFLIQRNAAAKNGKFLRIAAFLFRGIKGRDSTAPARRLWIRAARPVPARRARYADAAQSLPGRRKRTNQAPE